MTALVALESFADVNEVVTVTRPDVTRASTTYLRTGYKVSIDELLHLLLIGSDNAAARVLARVSPHGSDGFIARMNEKARELGLTQTQFEDPSGLLSGNIAFVAQGGLVVGAMAVLIYDALSALERALTRRTGQRR